MRSQSHGGPRTRSPKPALCRVRGPGAGDVATTYRPPVRGRRSSRRTQLDSCLSRGGRRSGLRPGQERRRRRKGLYGATMEDFVKEAFPSLNAASFSPPPPPPEAVAPVLIHSQQQNNLPPRGPPSRHLPSKRGCQRGTPARHGSKSSFMYTLHPRTYINTCLLILSQGCTHTEPALVLASAACVCFTAYLRLYPPPPLPPFLVHVYD